ncbi:FG-GAP-like repeat-containing protein [Dactylosporangium sp. CA-233914]|uniref:FG-GAP-like repeat-containing protein n=1 Tax=Dactylosporangium sp. CA-233914 TaxID=3239934 RepID=UPI003D946B5A
MSGLSRRRLLAAGAAGAASIAIPSLFRQPSAAASPAPEARPPCNTLAGQWARFGMDTRNTCYQPMPGKIKKPKIVARTYLGGTTAWVKAVDLNDDGKRDLLFISGGQVVAKDARLADRWVANGLSPADIFGVFDLAGDGSRQVVVIGGTKIYALSANDGSIQWQHDFAEPDGSGQIFLPSMQIAKLDNSVAGLQMVVWPYHSAFGYAFAFDGGVKSGRQIWQTSQAYAQPAYAPEVLVGDVNADGRNEVLIAGYAEISTFAGATGALLDGSDGGWNGRVQWETGPNIDGRNYGHIQLVNLGGGPGLEVVDLADGVTLHAAVIQNSSSGLSLLWDKFIEYTENHKALRSTVNSVADVDGDGRIEIVCGLFNDTGDNRWHVLVADAVGGIDSPKLDLADRYLRAIQDFDGDGKAELLVSVETTQTPGTQATLELYAVGADGTYHRVWSLPGSVLVTDPVSDYPSTLSPASRTNRHEALRCDPLASFVVISGNSLHGYTVSGGAVTQTWSRPYDGGVLHRVTDLDGDGTAEVLYQTLDGYLRLEKPDGTLIGQTTLAGLAGIATAADLDGRKRNAIIVPGFGAVRVFDYSKGKLVRRWQQPGQGEYVYHQPAQLESVPAFDLDGDGRSELVFVDTVDSHARMRVLDATGREVWHHVFEDLPAPTFNGPNGPYLWTFGRFTGKQGLDIYVGANRAGYNTEVSRILNGRSGALLASRDDGPGHVGQQFGPWTGAPAVGDLNGNGIDNTLFLAGDLIYNIDGTDMAGMKILEGHVGAYHTPVIADVDGDGRAEVLMTAGYNNLDVIKIDAEGNGTTLWREDTGLYSIGLFARRSAVVDVDADGTVELATLSDLGVLTCRNAATGEIKWSFTIPGSGLAPNVIAVDIDGDGHIEYVVGTQDGTVYAIDTTAHARNRIKWSLTIGARLGDVAAADIDGDNRSELLVTAEDGYLYVIDTK